MTVASDVAVQALAAGGELGVVDVRAVAAQRVDVAVVDDPDVLEPGHAAADPLDGGEVLLGLDDDADGPGVREDPPDLLGGGGLVDRHGHRAGRPQREVGERSTRTGSGS